MDPFEVRMQFLALLKRLNASQQSIQKIVGYALKYFSRCGEDLWECIVEECHKGSLNTRINILYLLDSLCEHSLLAAPERKSGANELTYVQYVSRDLHIIVQLVVPDSRDGLMNLQSTFQILENWRSKRLLDPQVVEEAIETLERRRENLQSLSSTSQPSQDSKPSHREAFSKSEVFKRIEEDRERHKRLRERRWVQPIDRSDPPPGTSRLATFLPHPLAGTTTHSVTTSPVSPYPHPTYPSTGATGGSGTASVELAMDIEFENAWETTSDWNEDDIEAIAEENVSCFPPLPQQDITMDVS